MFDDGVVTLSTEFPLEDFAWTVVVKKQEVPVISANGNWDYTDEVIET